MKKKKKEREKRRKKKAAQQKEMVIDNQLYFINLYACTHSRLKIFEDSLVFCTGLCNAQEMCVLPENLLQA